ncbi:MAG: leucyl/phenylalanyl-tRNA--protein transferase, partial [Sphingomonadales bacterium]
MDLTPDLLLKAYACGLFPMAESAQSKDVFWVEPNKRGIIPLSDVHVPRRLKKTIRQVPFDVRVDTAFKRVMELCAETTTIRRETWINAQIVALYTRLFDIGQAHSIECWDGTELVGGLYGVRLAGAFFGESMFHRATDASKIALINLNARLKAGGYSLLDTQYLTDHLSQFGAREIDREAYQELLAQALQKQAYFYQLPVDAAPDVVLQS